ncbi:MAG: hypothetical protein ACK41W_07860, partial [Cyanobacteriota bacterium]
MSVSGRCGQSAPSGSDVAAQQKHLEPRVLDLCTERIISALQLLRGADPAQFPGGVPQHRVLLP